MGTCSLDAARRGAAVGGPLADHRRSVRQHVALLRTDRSGVAPIPADQATELARVARTWSRRPSNRRGPDPERWSALACAAVHRFRGIGAHLGTAFLPS